MMTKMVERKMKRMTQEQEDREREREGGGRIIKITSSPAVLHIN